MIVGGSSFSVCTNGDVVYSISCTGPDCDSLQTLGLHCTSNSGTVSCSNGVQCSESPIYTSTLQLSLGSSSPNTINTLQLGCETNTFAINGSAVGPLTTDDSQCPGYGTTSSNSTATASTPVVLGTAKGQSSPSAAATNTTVSFAPSPSVGVLQSNRAVNFKNAKRHASFSLMWTAVLVIFSLWPQTVYAYEAPKDDRAVEDMLYRHRTAHSFAQVEPATARSKRGPLGASMNDIAAMSDFRSWFENNESLEIASLCAPDSQFMTDVFHFACAAVSDVPESDVLNKVSFTHHWQECVVYTEETFIKHYNGPNGSYYSEPLAVHGFLLTALAKGFCDLAFASILTHSFDSLAPSNVCSSILPPLETYSGSAPPGTLALAATSTAGSGPSSSTVLESAASSYVSNYIAKSGFESSALPPWTSIGYTSFPSQSSHLPASSNCVSSGESTSSDDSKSNSGPVQSITSSTATKSGSSSGDISASSVSTLSSLITPSSPSITSASSSSSTSLSASSLGTTSIVGSAEIGSSSKVVGGSSTSITSSSTLSIASSSQSSSTASSPPNSISSSLPSSTTSSSTSTPPSSTLSKTASSTSSSLPSSTTSSPPSNTLSKTASSTSSSTTSSGASSLVTTATSTSQSSIPSSTTSIPTLTGVSSQVVTNPTSCYQMPTPTANLLKISESDTVNTSLQTGLDLFLDPVTSSVVYVGIPFNSSEYLYDFSNYPTKLAIIMPSGSALVIDNNGFHAFAADCSQEADLLVPNLFQQLASNFAFVETLTKRQTNVLTKRAETNFQVDLKLTDQWSALVTTQLFPSNAVALGKSPCALLPSPQTNPSIGVWAWGCQYPGIQSAQGQCELAVTNLLNAITSAIGTIPTSFTVAWYYLLYGPARGLFEFTALVPILRTGVQGVGVILNPVGYLSLAITVARIANIDIAGNFCAARNDTSYGLVFTPAPGQAIDLTPLGSAPVFVLSYSETIQNSKEPPNCTPPTTCQPSTAQLDEAWVLPCNVVPNPGLDMDGTTVFGNPAFPAIVWGISGIYSEDYFGYGGMNGTGLSDGSNGCASGKAGDTCVTFQTDPTVDGPGAIGWLSTASINYTQLQNTTYVFSAYVDFLSVTGTPVAGSTTSGCSVYFYVVYGPESAQGSCCNHLAATFTQPTNGFQVISLELPLIVNAPVNGGFGVGVQCPGGVTGTFVIDQLSMCTADGLCASPV